MVPLKVAGYSVQPYAYVGVALVSYGQPPAVSFELNRV